LDGHFVMERELAERGQYPAINILKSFSRVMKQIASSKHQDVAQQIRSLMATYEQNRELIIIGAYKRGTDQEIDKAITYQTKHQDVAQQIRSLMATYEQNRELIQSGAYKRGTDQEIDKAITYQTNIQDFLKQGVHDSYTFDESIKEMEELLNGGGAQ